MGLFDEIRVEQILPGNLEITNRWYQTKSLEKVMTRYVISTKGELYEDRWDYKWVENKEFFLKGHLEKIKESYRREYLTDYHGEIIFYDGRDSYKGKLRNYHARFTDGKLSKLWYNDINY